MKGANEKCCLKEEKIREIQLQTWKMWYVIYVWMKLQNQFNIDQNAFFNKYFHECTTKFKQ